MSATPTLREWAESFFRRREADGYGDVPNERRTWRVLLEPAHFIDWPLRRIKTPDVLRWRDEALARPPSSPNGQRVRTATVGRKRVSNALILLRVALREAVQRGIIPSNPALEVEVRKARSSVPRWTYLDLEEQARLLAVASADGTDGERSAPGGHVQADGREHWILRCLMGTALRPSEAASLRRADVYLDGPTPHVLVCRGRNDRSTKNGRARRVPLFGIALEAAIRWSEILPEYAPHNPQGLFFPTQAGARQRRFFHWQWPRWIREAKLAPTDRRDGLPVRLYDATRHTCATSLLNGLWGMPWRLEDVSALLGHADVTVTQAHYARVIPDRLLELGRQAEAERRALTAARERIADPTVRAHLATHLASRREVLVRYLKQGLECLAVGPLVALEANAVRVQLGGIGEVIDVPLDAIREVTRARVPPGWGAKGPKNRRVR